MVSIYQFAKRGGERTSDVNLYLTRYDESIFRFCPLTVKILELLKRRVIKWRYSKSLLHRTLDQPIG